MEENKGNGGKKDPHSKQSTRSKIWEWYGKPLLQLAGWGLALYVTLKLIPFLLIFVAAIAWLGAALKDGAKH